LNNNLLKLDK